MAALESQILPAQELIDNPERVFQGDDATVQRKIACIEGIVQNHTITHGAEHAGVSRQHVHKWIQRDPAFAEAVAEALDESTERLETSMYKRAMEKDTIAGIFLLKKYNPEFRDKVTVDLGEVQQRICQMLERMSVGQLQRLPAVMTEFVDTGYNHTTAEYQPIAHVSLEIQKED